MSRLKRLPAGTHGAQPPYPTRDLNVLAATLAAGEIGSEHTHRAGWLARYARDVEIIGYLDHVIPGPTSIMDLRGSLGRSLQHTLLRYEDGHQWPSSRSGNSTGPSPTPSATRIVECRNGSGRD